MSSWDQKSSLFCKKVKNRRNFCVFEDFLKGFFEISLFGKTLFTGNQCHQNTNQTCVLALLTAACSAHIFLSSFLEKNVCNAILLYKETCIFAKSKVFRSTVSVGKQKQRIHFLQKNAKCTVLSQNLKLLPYTSRFIFARFVQERCKCFPRVHLFSHG